MKWELVLYFNGLCWMKFIKHTSIVFISVAQPQNLLEVHEPMIHNVEIDLKLKLRRSENRAPICRNQWPILSVNSAFPFDIFQALVCRNQWPILRIRLSWYCVLW